MFVLIDMSGGLRSVFWGMSLVMFLICSSGIQTQAVTWGTYGSVYEYTEETTFIFYENGRKSDKITSEDSLIVWNVTAVNDKVYFQTNFTPYFMGLQPFETQEEYDTYLAEHYWYDNVTDSMYLAYSVVGTDFCFVDMLDCNLAYTPGFDHEYNASISDFDIRSLYHEMYGLFLPVNHTLFSFKTEFNSDFITEKPIQDLVFTQEDTFVLDRMKYEGYYIYLEYSFFKYFLDYDARYDIKFIAKYSLNGELYSYEINQLTYDVSHKEKMQYYEKLFSLDSLYRQNGVRRISFTGPLVIFGSLILVTYALTKRRRN
jgi:hypothetical protein